jgi:hypothetical protein
VELLVSIAVIALLTSVLLPGLSGARESGRQATCACTSRHLMLAVTAYAGDFRGVAPPASSQALRNLDRWHGKRARVADAFAPEGGALAHYLGEDGVAPVEPGGVGARGARVCPSFAATLAALASAGEGFERSCGGYGYNARFVGTVRSRDARGVWAQTSDRSGSPLHRFADPAGTLAFADAAIEYPGVAGGAGGGGGSGAGVIEYSFIEPRWWPDVPGHRPDPSMHFRHGGTASGPGVATVILLDGHARALRRALAWSSGMYGESTTDPRTGWPEPLVRGHAASADPDDNALFDYE